MATGNRHKLTEAGQILGSEFCLLGLDSLPPYTVPEESGSTFEENAAIKALAASQYTPLPVIADDSGLEVDALGGAPGVRSARFAGACATDADNVALLLEKMSDIRGKKRTARFRCVMALALGGRVLGYFHGVVEGLILNRPRGAGGFGYDPIFLPRGFCRSFAQLEPAEKNALSHRGRALEALRQFLFGPQGLTSDA